jgi:hypothetical protein
MSDTSDTSGKITYNLKINVVDKGNYIAVDEANVLAQKLGEGYKIVATVTMKLSGTEGGDLQIQGYLLCGPETK